MCRIDWEAERGRRCAAALGAMKLGGGALHAFNRRLGQDTFA